MAMKTQKPSTENKTLPLLLGGLVGIGIIVLYFLYPGFQVIDMILLFVITIILVTGWTQGIVRSIVTGVIIYLSTGMAASLYHIAAPYMAPVVQLMGILWNAVIAVSQRSAAPEIDPTLSGGVGYNTLAVSFGFLMIVIWIILEIITRVFFEDTYLPKLGFLDILGGIAGYLIVGIWIASLLFNTLGYGMRFRHAHNEALLRRKFNQVLYGHCIVQSFWFPGRPPSIYTYDLDWPRER